MLPPGNVQRRIGNSANLQSEDKTAADTPAETSHLVVLVQTSATLSLWLQHFFIKVSITPLGTVVYEQGVCRSEDFILKCSFFLKKHLIIFNLSYCLNYLFIYMKLGLCKHYVVLNAVRV